MPQPHRRDNFNYLRSGELVQIPEASVKASCGSGLLEKTQSLQYFDVADFDDHLHDPEKDWTNAELNGKLALAKAAGA